MTNVLFYRPSQRGLFMLFPSDRHGSWRQVSLRRAGWLLLDHPRHASVHTAGTSMDVQTAYGILGLDSSASFDGIKSAYRSLAKQYHPDKNSSHVSTALFQQLNHAYQTLIKCHLSAGHDSDSSPAGPVCVDSWYNPQYKGKLFLCHNRHNRYNVSCHSQCMWVPPWSEPSWQGC